MIPCTQTPLHDRITLQLAHCLIILTFLPPSFQISLLGGNLFAFAFSNRFQLIITVSLHRLMIQRCHHHLLGLPFTFASDFNSPLLLGAVGPSETVGF